MLKIKEIYSKILHDEEIVFQVKSNSSFNKIIAEMKAIFNKYDFMSIEDYLNYKDTYFILGNWRDGMFTLKIGKINDYDKEIEILADYKENPIYEQKHLEQINSLIKIMDKYRKYFVKKRLYFDKKF